MWLKYNITQGEYKDFRDGIITVSFLRRGIER